MGDFKKLKVWQKSHPLALAVYGSTAGFLIENGFGLEYHLLLARDLGVSLITTV